MPASRSGRVAAGKHVMSETAANTTFAEGVALCRAVEESGLVYMLAENYAYTTFSQEMHRLYRDGEIGEVTYAEGEYNHPMPAEQQIRLAPGANHWRNWIPSTYYCTHALAPLMYITDCMPRSVNALSIARSDITARTTRRSDRGSVMLCRMDNGSVFRIFGIVLPGHSNWYRVHGTGGAMELTRGTGYFGPGRVRVWHEEWQRPGGQPCERVYLPDWPPEYPACRALEQVRTRWCRLLDELLLRPGDQDQQTALPRRLPRGGHDQRRDSRVEERTRQRSARRGPGLRTRGRPSTVCRRPLVSLAAARRARAAAAEYTR